MGPSIKLSIRSVAKTYGPVSALADASLDLAEGEFLTLLGPSGSGKSTLLMIVAGLIQPTAGEVWIGGKLSTFEPPNKRDIGVVFQNYALFPHLSVRENVAYGLRARGVRRAEIMPRVEAALDAVQMQAFAERLPRALSGGQQQRVSLARAVVTEPSVLLLDEPFAALDRSLRLDLQLEIRRLQRQLALTAVMVTHDQDEAMSMADRVAVLSGGTLEQFDTPAGVYDRPATPFVAGFVGATNLLSARLALRDGRPCLRLADGTLPLEACTALPGPVQVSIRPEQWELAVAGRDSLPQAEVVLAMPLGPTLLVDLRLADGVEAKLSMPRGGDDAPPQAGSRVALRLRPGAPVRIFA